jgi:hypothetical protein
MNCDNCYTRLYPKVRGLAAWSENCKWYSSLPLGALYRYLVIQSSEFCRRNPLCCFSASVYCCCYVFRYRLSPETFGYTLVVVFVQDIAKFNQKVELCCCLASGDVSPVP